MMIMPQRSPNADNTSAIEQAIPSKLFDFIVFQYQSH